MKATIFELEVEYAEEFNIFRWKTRTSYGDFEGHSAVQPETKLADLEKDSRLQISAGCALRLHPAGEFMYRAMQVRQSFGEPDFRKAMLLYMAVDLYAEKLMAAKSIKEIDKILPSDKLIKEALLDVTPQIAQFIESLTEQRKGQLNEVPVQDS